MITFIGGKPGASKTCYAVGLLIDELKHTNRPVVTNMAMKLQPWVDGKGVPRKGLLRYLEDTYGQTFDAERRIVLMEDDEVIRFYAIRPVWRESEQRQEVVRLGLEEDHRFRFKAGDNGMTGVAYFIDEAHEFWPNRDWQKLWQQGPGRELLSWGSQQRRAGDDAFFLTQVIENVEKKVLGLSQECHYLTNHGLKPMGPFRQPNVVMVRVTGGTPPRESETALRWEKIKYNRQELYHCYDTAAGVGVAGRGADIGRRARGLHWAFIPLGAAGVLAVIVWGFVFLRDVVYAKAVKGLAPSSVGAAVTRAAGFSPARVPAAAAATNVVASTRAGGVVIDQEPEEKKPKVVGLVHGSAGWAVSYDDGVVVSARTVKEAGRYVMVDGELYPRAGAIRGMRKSPEGPFGGGRSLPVTVKRP